MARYSAILLDHFFSPRNQGTLEEAGCEGFAALHRHGPFFRFEFRLDGDVVRDVRFQTFGCGAAIGCGSFLTELIRGRTVNECLAITSAELVEAVGGLPDEKQFCAALAIEALHNGLEPLAN